VYDEAAVKFCQLAELIDHLAAHAARLQRSAAECTNCRQEAAGFGISLILNNHTTTENLHAMAPAVQPPVIAGDFGSPCPYTFKPSLEAQKETVGLAQGKRTD
jgi:hypothetical protein